MSGPFRLCVLEAGAFSPPLDQRFGHATRTFEAIFRRNDAQISIHRFPVYENIFPERPGDFDGLLLTGSRHGTYEAHAWLEPLKALVREAALARPVVGVCFGHQLIAEAFGGRSGKSPRGWGIGVHRYTVARAPDWWPDAPASLDLRVSHQDQVSAPPPGAEVLADNDFCPVGMMQVGANVVSLQPHPEMTADLAASVYTLRRDLLGAAAADAAIASLQTPTQDDAMVRALIAFLRRRRAALD